ncbi:MAG: hypothetical protein AAB406_00400 [Pseudomonadota bacterium]
MLKYIHAAAITGLLAAGSSNLPPEPADLEMLEFLGAFETQGGQWLDPLSLDDREPEKPKPAREEKQHE